MAFNNLSLNANSGVEWTFEGGQPETSTESNPVVSYAEPGFYSVKIKAFNNEVSDSLTISSYIHVLDNETAPYSEDFEEQSEIVDGWTISGTSENQSWELNSNVGFQSDRSIFIENFNIVGNGQSELTSQSIDLTQMDTAFISMRAAFAQKLNSDYEAMRVFINTDCGEEWTLKKVFTGSNSLPSIDPTNNYFIPETDDEWRYLVVDNIDPDERTENFRFRFVFYNNGGNNIYLDDINISELNLLASFEQKDLDGDVNLYPNPTAGDVNISLSLRTAETVSLHLMGADGKLLFQDGPTDFTQGTHNINLSLGSMSPGSYILEMVGESGILHRKIILTRD